MTASEWLLLSAGIVVVSLAVLRIAFCRVARRTEELARDHGWRGPLRRSLWDDALRWLGGGR